MKTTKRNWWGLTLLTLALPFVQLQAQSFDWGKAVEIVDNSVVAGLPASTDVETDAQGNVFLAGTFSGIFDFGGGEVASSGDFVYTPDGFIAKYNSSGEFAWVEPVPSFIGGVDDIELDVAGNIYLLANFKQDITVAGTQVVAGPQDDGFIVAKLNPARELQWVASVLLVNTFSTALASSIELSPNGDLIVAGFFNGEVEIGGAVLTSTPGDGNHFLATISQDDGAWGWARAVSNISPLHAYIDVATDSEGNIYATSAAIGVSDFGGIVVDAFDQQIFFLAKYDASGNGLWVSHSLGSSSSLSDRGRAVEVHPTNGDIFVAGTFVSNEFLIGGATIQEPDFCCGEVFLAKFNTSGQMQWVRQSHGGTGQVNSVADLALSDDGGVWLTGKYGGTNGGDAIFGEGAGQVTLSAGSNNSVFVARYAANGDLEWAKGVHGNSIGASSTAADIAAAGLGSAVVTGIFNENLVVGNTTLTGTPDAFSGNIFIFKIKGSASSLGGVELSPELKLRLSPNPTPGILQVSWKNDGNPLANLQVTDQLGRIVNNISLRGDSAGIDLSGFESGVYSLTLRVGEKVAVEQFVLAR